MDLGKDITTYFVQIVLRRAVCEKLLELYKDLTPNQGALCTSWL